jgi:hypothetical protein
MRPRFLFTKKVGLSFLSLLQVTKNWREASWKLCVGSRFLRRRSGNPWKPLLPGKCSKARSLAVCVPGRVVTGLLPPLLCFRDWWPRRGTGGTI